MQLQESTPAYIKLVRLPRLHRFSDSGTSFYAAVAVIISCCCYATWFWSLYLVVIIWSRGPTSFFTSLPPQVYSGWWRPAGIQSYYMQWFDSVLIAAHPITCYWLISAPMVGDLIWEPLACSIPKKGPSSLSHILYAFIDIHPSCRSFKCNLDQPVDQKDRMADMKSSTSPLLLLPMKGPTHTKAVALFPFAV